uniref:hypothetical protein n=1 Tax=Staphylococcus epidermidis TaxID=1282 RepID=UPI0037D9AE02
DNEMADGVVKSGKSVQVVAGMCVGEVREGFEKEVLTEGVLGVWGDLVLMLG